MDPVGRTKFGVLALGSIAAALILWLSTSFWLDAWHQHEDARGVRRVAALENRIAVIAHEVADLRARDAAAAPGARTPAPFAFDARLDATLADVDRTLDEPGLVAGLRRSPAALRAGIAAVERARARLGDERPDRAPLAATAPHDGLVDALHGLQDALGFEPRVALRDVRTLRRVRADVRDLAEAVQREARGSPAPGATSARALAERLTLDADASDLEPALSGEVADLLAFASPVGADAGAELARRAAALDGMLHEAIDAAARASGAHALRRLLVDTLLIVACFWIVLAALRLLGNVQHQGWHDRVTGLPNRFRFERLLERALHGAAGTGDGAAGGGVGVLVLDVDGFKTVNESVGHGAGDALLRALAERLAAHLGARGTLAALGADEFAALLPRVGSTEAAARIAEGLRIACREPFEVEGASVSVTLAAGVATFDPSAPTAEEEGRRITATALLGRADAALRRAKDEGGDRTSAFDRALATRNRERVRLERALRTAVANGELELHYQPKVGTRSGRVDGLEALVRWRHPELGLVSPGLFVPIAERSGLICGIGAWVLEEAVRQNVAWHRAGLDGLSVAVNVSAAQFAEAGFVERVGEALRRHGLPADRLELELTESVAMADTTSVVERLGRLRASGVSIAIDDFGTGYSSLQYLGELPLDTLKIDRAFIVGLGGEGRARFLARTIVTMARSLELATVAEGVETPEQLARVLALGCDEVQGFHYSGPVPADEVPATVARIDARLARELVRAA